MTKWKDWSFDYGTVDLVCGGTPCQSFSVAGLRKGLDDERGNLCLEFVKIVNRVRPRWVVWENVPGVLSSNGGRDFGAFLGGLAESGYGFAYRVLDAQYIRVDGYARAVPQRRRRVFVVGHLGDWRPAAAVLLESESLRGNPAPRRETGQGIAADVVPSLTASGRGVERAGETRGQDPVVAVPHRMVACAEVSPCMTAGGAPFERTGNERTECDAIVAIREMCLMDQGGSVMNVEHGITGTLRRETKGHEPIEVHGTQDPDVIENGAHPLGRNHGQEDVVAQQMSVRRLTPVECERLQGFPDGYTAIPWRGKPAGQCPDGPRYKALGNSWAVNCARWVFNRIEMVDETRKAVK